MLVSACVLDSLFNFLFAQGKGMRFVKNVGLGFKTPKTAREGNYVDKKCPFTGDVSIRGRILKVRCGTVRCGGVVCADAKTRVDSNQHETRNTKVFLVVFRLLAYCWCCLIFCDLPVVLL